MYVKWSKKNGPKNDPKNSPKNSPKNGPKIGPVHILPYAVISEYLIGLPEIVIAIKKFRYHFD